MNATRGNAVRGVAWSAIERFSVQGIQFLVSIILARLLTPADFGLVAIVIVFSSIFQTINESGFNVALIHKLNRDELDYSTAFVANLGIGVVSYALLFVCAPLIADFYDNEVLTNVMRILSLNLVINSIGLVPMAMYTIRIDFKTQAKASFFAAVLSGIVGIIVAYVLRNVYAIVIQQILFNVVYVSLMIVFIKWIPSFKFSAARFNGLFQYAYKLIGARVISVVFDDLYSLAIGKIYSPAILGCYNRAQSFRLVLSKNIVNIVQRVSIPILCQAQEDNVQMKRVLLKFLSSTALIVYPMLFGLMSLSEPLVLVLLGEKWIFVSELLYYTCPIGFFYLVSTFNRNIYNATGRTDLALKTEVLKKCVFVCIFLFTMKYDIRIFLIGLITISVFEMLIDITMARKQIGVTMLEELKSLVGIVLSCLAMSVCIFFVNIHAYSPIAQLFMGFFIGTLTYVGLCYLFNIADFKIVCRAYVTKIFR